ncbi:hypothetical protein MYSTI_05899 [Myxococcus stipitatus DSM 14675]|uniref:Glycosyltransferase RgtA/B/C/D-like domain-containing protein n=2 Tax=Myxococcus stipitatus TaxID=83455 RepID=L7UL45_MYXSD|nr:hypothetical protein MYSTI_05899 [Myxococcus stipitatus DSM 14675]
MSPLFRRMLHPLVLLVFTLLSVVHTWPLVPKLHTHLVTGREDVLASVWQTWWSHQALWVEPQNPFFAPGLHWPLGAELYWHTPAFAKSMWGAVLVPFMSPEAAYNLLILSTFVLTGYTAWLLMRYLLERAGVAPVLAAVAALAGASVFDFSRYHLAHATTHLNLSALEGLPLYLYFFFRWLDEGQRKWLVGLGLATLYTMLCDYYYLVYLALFSFAWVVMERWRHGPLVSVGTLKDATVRRAGWAALAAAVACLPMAMTLAVHLFPAPVSQHHGDSDYFTDLYAFFIPDTLSAWMEALPRWAREFSVSLVRGKMATNAEEAGSFLGWLTPVIAVFALWRGVPDGRRWVGLGLAFAALSMGTVLNIGLSDQTSPFVPLLLITLLVASVPAWRGRSWHRDVVLALGLCTVTAAVAPFTAFGHEFRFAFPLPYLAFKHVVPLFTRGGMPVRLALPATLVLGVLVSFGAAYLGQLASRWGKAAMVGAALLVAVVPNVEYLSRPLKMVQMPTLPPIFDEIRDAPMPAAVFTDHVLGQWEQTRHGKPVSVARQARLPVRETALTNLRVYRALEGRHEGYSPVSPEEREEMRAFLKQNHYRWFVAHYHHPARERFVVEELGGERAYSDGYVTVYRFP